MDDRLHDAIEGFALTEVTALTNTPHAQLYKALGIDGAPCVLKLYREGHFGNEASGIALMNLWSESAPLACVQILGEGPGALLMEYIPGPLLGEDSRKGFDLDACQRLALVARALHAVPLPDLSRLPRLELWFGDLFNLQYAPNCPEGLRRDMGLAGDLARRMLTTDHKVRPLHGDLHHDNVIVGAHPKAIDAKGILGDPAYELANAMRNPKGCAKLQRDRDHQSARLHIFAEGLDVDPARLAAWAAAKAALSIAWRAKGVLGDDLEADVLSLLLDLAQDFAEP
ncbi:aminoglycoside phosphotransferase family protein [Tropicibacter naphthalenivorans]|uniref:Aminoglycoside/hydroxyurea antibiotic resistance kinase n=1 Tax=Tropicibacter naphthalenivorans TaxID=441103 RepID=A0A0P1GP62_9RHOB|nr:aminoglycoside phosphotransferase family protein [Tropicibacter naphthalenivorans]CUH77604.1 Aminoglycoside/hydroxyurea antibiotic resistance kinase [Tropicibacter naphthalenivorans]SMC54989.1 streptomycin 6-kinase [Tropicibacter naphthalenivorans]